MLRLFKYLLTVVLLSGLVHGIAQNVCEVCSCDNPINVTTVHCDGRNLSSLTGMLLNSTIETLSLANNSLMLQSGDLAQINNLTSLTTLILSNNPLSTIPELSLLSLMHLELDNTSLTNATFPSSFANCTRLQTLVLSNNKFTKLMATDFTLLTALTNITLDHVQLTSIEPSAWKHLSNSLQIISLRANSLESTEFLPVLTNLLEVDLDSNKLEQIPTVLMAPGQTKRLFLRNNEISTVNESSPLFQWAAANRSDIEIYLSNNSFDCCQSRWFLGYLNGMHNLVKDSANLTCALPAAYTGKRLLDLRADLMDCSGNPFHPSHIHISKLAVLVSCLISIVIFIVVVVILTLYRRNRLHFRHRRHYERVQGANVHA